MSINSFFLDEEFNALLERRSKGKRGSVHASIRQLTASPLPSVKQGENAPVPAKPGARETIQGANPQVAAETGGVSDVRMGVLKGLTQLSQKVASSKKKAAAKYRPEKATRTKLAQLGYEFPHGVPAPEGAKRHGEGNDPSKRLFTSGKGGRTGTAHVAAGPTDEGPHVNVVKFGPDKAVSVTHADVPQTEPDVPSLSSTSRTTGGQMGRTGVETHGVGNPGHESEVRRQEREAERVAAGKEPGTGHVQRVSHLVTSGGGSTGQLSIRRDPSGETSLIGRMRTGPGLGKVGRGTSHKGMPNSGGDNPTDNVLRLAAAKVKADKKASKEAAAEPAKGKKVVSGADLDALRAQHGYKP